MMQMDTYLNLCTEVYDLSKSNPPKEDFNFYRSYIVEAQGLILEPMCGTGRFLLPLVAEGFEIDGFDGSPHMLDALQRKAKTMNLTVNVWQQLVEELKIQKKYKLIFIPSGSFGLITNLKDVQTALQTFHSLLEVGGKLVFEVETLKSIPVQFNVWHGDMYTRDDKKFIVASFLDLPLQNNIGRTICRYELIDANIINKTEIEIIKIRLYEPESLLTLLEEIGFKEIKTIQSFDRNKKPSQNEKIIIYECVK